MTRYSTNKAALVLAPRPQPASQPADLSPFDQCCHTYRQRSDALVLIKQLSQLIKAVQQHRGLSMALLAGDQQFLAEFEALQRQLDRRIAILTAFAQQSENLLSTGEQRRIDDAWLTLKSGWQDDTVIDNFELHCHLIDQLLNLMTQLGKYLERPMVDCLVESTEPHSTGAVDTAGGSTPRINSKRLVTQLGLLAFVCKLMPDMIEMIAKIRGLATHAIVAGGCDELCAQKLRYLLRCARAQREKLQLGMGRMTDSVRQQMSGLQMIKTYDLKLMYMIDKVERELLEGDGVGGDQAGFFELASDIIGVYVSVVNQGLELLQDWQQQQLESWLVEGA